MGTVYLLSEWDNTENVIKYKIGITKNSVEKRIKQLSTGNSRDITMVRQYQCVEYKKVEKMLHRMYSDKRDNREWFHLSDEDVFSFLDKCKEADEIISFLRENNTFYK